VYVFHQYRALDKKGSFDSNFMQIKGEKKSNDLQLNYIHVVVWHV